MRYRIRSESSGGGLIIVSPRLLIRLARELLARKRECVNANGSCTTHVRVRTRCGFLGSGGRRLESRGGKGGSGNTPGMYVR